MATTVKLKKVPVEASKAKKTTTVSKKTKTVKVEEVAPEAEAPKVEEVAPEAEAPKKTVKVEVTPEVEVPKPSLTPLGEERLATLSAEKPFYDFSADLLLSSAELDEKYGTARPKALPTGWRGALKKTDNYLVGKVKALRFWVFGDEKAEKETVKEKKAA